MDLMLRLGELYPFLVAIAALLSCRYTERFRDETWLGWCVIGAVLLSFPQRWAENYVGVLVVCVTGVSSSVLFLLGLPRINSKKSSRWEFAALVAVVLSSVVFQRRVILEVGFSLFVYLHCCTWLSREIQPIPLTSTLTLTIAGVLAVAASGNGDLLALCVLAAFTAIYANHLRFELKSSAPQTESRR